MPIYKGADKVFEISLGGTPVTEVFRGATKIWPEAAPVVSIAPTSGTGLAGTVINFTATATGAAITYQWNIDGAPVSGQTGTTYAHTIAGNVSITCTVTDGYGQSTISNAAPITQQAAVAVSIAPTSGAGYAGAVINFTATASGGSGTYTYQWKANGTNIGGATAATYAHTIAGNTSITCVATSSGSSATSNAAAITQYAALAATIAPTSGVGYAGTVVNFTATPSGGSGAYTYQWKANGTNIGGATAATYAHTIAGNTSITCTVSSAGASVTSNAAAITQWAAVGITIAPTSFSGTEGAVINYTSTATGGSGTYTYQWKLNGANIGGATAATYNRTTVLADNGKTITCTVTSSGQSATSNGSLMTITAAFDDVPYITLPLIDQTIGSVLAFRGSPRSAGAAWGPPGGGKYTAFGGNSPSWIYNDNNVASGQAEWFQGRAGQFEYQNTSNVFVPFNEFIISGSARYGLGSYTLVTPVQAGGTFSGPLVYFNVLTANPRPDVTPIFDSMEAGKLVWRLLEPGVNSTDLYIGGNGNYDRGNYPTPYGANPAPWQNETAQTVVTVAATRIDIDVSSFAAQNCALRISDLPGYATGRKIRVSWKMSDPATSRQYSASLVNTVATTGGTVLESLTFLNSVGEAQWMEITNSPAQLKFKIQANIALNPGAPKYLDFVRVELI